MNRNLMEAIVYLAAFLELSDDDTVDPDSAVKQLENMSVILQRLSADERHEFIAFLNEFAAEQEKNWASKDFLEFIRSFAYATDLTDEEDDEVPELS